MSAKKALSAQGQFSLGREAGNVLNESRFALLEKISATGSITKAAKAVGISYRTAWLTVDHLNALDEWPLVERNAGGKSGGGTHLTDKGLELLKMYRTFKIEHGKYLERLRAGIHDFDRFLNLTQKISLKTSARNQLFGKVLSIKKDALSAVVVIALKGKDRIVSKITTQGLEGLGLRVGDEAYALIKANWISLIPPAAIKKGNPENHLKGKIISLRQDEGNSECILRLEGGNILVAAITQKAPKSPILKEAELIYASFNSSNVILGIPW